MCLKGMRIWYSELVGFSLVYVLWLLLCCICASVWESAHLSVSLLCVCVRVGVPLCILLFADLFVLVVRAFVRTGCGSNVF